MYKSCGLEKMNRIPHCPRRRLVPLFFTRLQTTNKRGPAFGGRRRSWDLAEPFYDLSKNDSTLSPKDVRFIVSRRSLWRTQRQHRQHMQDYLSK